MQNFRLNKKDLVANNAYTESLIKWMIGKRLLEIKTEYIKNVI